MSPKRPAFRPLGEVVGADAALGQWARRQRQEAELTRLVRRHLPRAIGERLAVAGIEDGTLVIVVAAGAIAAALRARGPDLVAALKRAGCGVTSLRVRIRIDAAPATEPALPTPRTLDAGAAAPLFDLAARLPDGPLKNSLARWSRRARGR
ncbi:MAG TPA: DciA family protein [Casimicrobiaceae bacterium]